MIKALTVQLQEQTAAYTTRWSGPNASTQQDMDKKYAWKRVPPKSGEPSTKRMYSDGKNKTYHWCPHHNQWTIHTAAECKRLKPTRGKKDYKNKKAIKRQNFKDKNQAFIQAKAAYEACLGVDSDDEQDTMDSDNDEGSNWLASSYSSEGSNDS
jgi:plasmid replication initiation protein